jgi:hypothetical protein
MEAVHIEQVTRNQALEDEIQELRRQRLVDITMIQNLR